MSWEATLYSNWACAGGAPIMDLSPLGADCAFEETIDQSSPLVLSLDARYHAMCARRRVIRLTLEDNVVREFRIDRRQRQVGGPTFALSALPPIYDLRDAGLIRQRVGARLLTQFSETGSIRALCEGPLLWNREADGLSWFDIGDIEFEDVYRFEWSRLTRFEFVQRIRSETRGETQLRRVGDAGYLFDAVRAIGSDATPVIARFGANLLQLDETVPDGSVATVITPHGIPEADSGAFAGPAQNVWRVASVTPDVGGDFVELRDPESNLLPFVEDSQLIDYGLTWDGAPAVRRILSATIATGLVRLNGDAPSVGTIVTLCQDDTGAPLEEMTSRLGLSESGRVVADLEIPGARSERNLLPNAALADGVTGLTRTGGTGQPWGVYHIDDTDDLAGSLAATASSTDTSLSVTGFPPNAVLRVGEYIEIVAATLTILTGGRTNAAGELTVALTSPTTFDLFDGGVLVLRGPLGQNYGTAIVDGDQASGVTSLDLRGLAPERTLTVGVSTLQLSVLSQSVGVAVFAFFIPGSGDSTSARWHILFGGTRLQSSILSTGFSRTVTWINGAVAWSGTAEFDYPAGADVLAVRVTQEMVFTTEWEPVASPFPAGDFQVRHDNSRFSTVRTVTASPAWASDQRATIAVDGTWDISSTDDNDVPGPQRTVVLNGFLTSVLSVGEEWIASDAAIELLALAAYKDGASLSSAFLGILPNSSTLGAIGQSAYVSAETTLDGSGAGVVPVSPALSVTSLGGSLVATRRCPDYRGGDSSGSEQLLFVTGGASSQEVRWPAVTVPVADGDSVTVHLKLWITAWSPLATGSVPITLRLRNGALAELAALSPDPNPTVILAEGGRGLPEYRILTIPYTLTETTTLVAAVAAGGTGLGPHQAFIRAIMLAVGTDADVPFTAGGFANVLVHTANQELLRSARPQPEYQVSLAAWDDAVARVPDLLPGIIPPIVLGGAVILEDVLDETGNARQVRVVGQLRTPGRRDAALTLGALDRSDLAYTVGRGLGQLPGGR